MVAVWVQGQLEASFILALPQKEKEMIVQMEGA